MTFCDPALVDHCIDFSPWRVTCLDPPSAPLRCEGCGRLSTTNPTSSLQVHVKPYAFTYVTKVKQRWVGLSLASGFANEFERFKANPQLLRDVVRRGLLRVVASRHLLKRHDAHHSTEPSLGIVRFCERMDDVAYPPLYDDAAVDALLHHQPLRPGDVVLNVLHKHETPMLLTGCPHSPGTDPVHGGARGELAPVKLLRFITVSNDGKQCFSGGGGSGNVLVVAKPSGMPTLPCGRNVFNALTTILEHSLPFIASSEATTLSAHYGALVGWASASAVEEQRALSEWISQHLPRRAAGRPTAAAAAGTPTTSSEATTALRVHPLHRLDTGTSGVLVLQLSSTCGTTPAVTSSSAAANKDDRVAAGGRCTQPLLSVRVRNKTYVAKVHGAFSTQAEAQGLVYVDGGGHAAVDINDDTPQQTPRQRAADAARRGSSISAEAADDGGHVHVCEEASCQAVPRVLLAVAPQRRRRQLWLACDWALRCNMVGHFYAVPVLQHHPDAGAAATPAVVDVTASFRVAGWASNTNGQKNATTLFRSCGCCHASAAATTSNIFCIPVTGRTHQIRVHCAAVGCPILGDVKYAGLGRPAAVGTDTGAQLSASVEDASIGCTVNRNGRDDGGGGGGGGGGNDGDGSSSLALCSECSTTQQTHDGDEGHVDLNEPPLERFCLHAISCEVAIFQKAAAQAKGTTRSGGSGRTAHVPLQLHADAADDGEETAMTGPPLSVYVVHADATATGLPCWWRCCTCPKDWWEG